MKKKQKTWKEDLQGILDLDYVVIKNVPMIQTKEGSAINYDYGLIETQVAKAILEKHVPIRGAEVKFFRKTLGLSYEKFARELSVASTTVMRWEQEKLERLSTSNEVLIKVFMAEKLGIELLARLSSLVSNDFTGKLELKVA